MGQPLSFRRSSCCLEKHRLGGVAQDHGLEGGYGDGYVPQRSVYDSACINQHLCGGPAWWSGGQEPSSSLRVGQAPAVMFESAPRCLTPPCSLTPNPSFVRRLDERPMIAPLQLGGREAPEGGPSRHRGPSPSPSCFSMPGISSSSKKHHPQRDGTPSWRHMDIPEAVDLWGYLDPGPLTGRPVPPSPLVSPFSGSPASSGYHTPVFFSPARPRPHSQSHSLRLSPPRVPQSHPQAQSRSLRLSPQTQYRHAPCRSAPPLQLSAHELEQDLRDRGGAWARGRGWERGGAERDRERERERERGWAQREWERERERARLQRARQRGESVFVEPEPPSAPSVTPRMGTSAVGRARAGSKGGGRCPEELQRDGTAKNRRSGTRPCVGTRPGPRQTEDITTETLRGEAGGGATHPAQTDQSPGTEPGWSTVVEVGRAQPTKVEFQPLWGPAAGLEVRAHAQTCSSNPSPSPGPPATHFPCSAVSPDPCPAVSPDPCPAVSPDPCPTVSPDPCPAVSPDPCPAVSPDPCPTVSPDPCPAVSPDPCPAVSRPPCSIVSPPPCSNVSPTPLSNVSPAPGSTVSPAPCSTASPAPCSNVSPAPCSNVSPAPSSVVSPAPRPGINPLNAPPAPSPPCAAVPASLPMPSPSSVSPAPSSCRPSLCPFPRPVTRPVPVETSVESTWPRRVLGRKRTVRQDGALHNLPVLPPLPAVISALQRRRPHSGSPSSPSTVGRCSLREPPQQHIGGSGGAPGRASLREQNLEHWRSRDRSGVNREGATETGEPKIRGPIPGPRPEEEPAEGIVEGKPAKSAVEGGPAEGALEEPAESTVEGEPAESAVKGEPAESAVKGEPAESAVKGEPAESAVKGEPAESAVEGEPAESTVEGEPAESAVEGEPAESAVEGEPAESAVEGEPAESAVEGWEAVLFMVNSLWEDGWRCEGRGFWGSHSGGWSSPVDSLQRWPLLRPPDGFGGSRPPSSAASELSLTELGSQARDLDADLQHLDLSQPLWELQLGGTKGDTYQTHPGPHRAAPPTAGIYSKSRIGLELRGVNPGPAAEAAEAAAADPCGPEASDWSATPEAASSFSAKDDSSPDSALTLESDSSGIFLSVSNQSPEDSGSELCSSSSSASMEKDGDDSTLKEWGREESCELQWCYPSLLPQESGTLQRSTNSRDEEELTLKNSVTMLGPDSSLLLLPHERPNKLPRPHLSDGEPISQKDSFVYLAVSARGEPEDAAAAAAAAGDHVQAGRVKPDHLSLNHHSVPHRPEERDFLCTDSFVYLAAPACLQLAPEGTASSTDRDSDSESSGSGPADVSALGSAVGDSDWDSDLSDCGPVWTCRGSACIKRPRQTPSAQPPQPLITTRQSPTGPVGAVPAGAGPPTTTKVTWQFKPAQRSVCTGIRKDREQEPCRGVEVAPSSASSSPTSSSSSSG